MDKPLQNCAHFGDLIRCSTRLKKNRNEASLEELEKLAEKNRKDLRHHALDATVIAATTRGFVQRLSTYSKYKREPNAKKFPLPFSDFREQLKQKLEEMLVSRYRKDRVQGALHEDTFYGAVRERDGSHCEDGDYKILYRPQTYLQIDRKHGGRYC